jgi:HEAT repeat protein
MNEWEWGLYAAAPASWMVNTDQVRSSTLILVVLVALGLLAVTLYWFGVIARVLSIVGVVIRGGIRTGFRVWESVLAWAPWPVFLGIQLTLLASGVVAAGPLPAATVGFALLLLGMGLAACLAYMFIDVERYEVARGHKALHDPLKGQRLATELARYGSHVGVPLLAAAAVGMVCGFALLNFGLLRLLGSSWYTGPTVPLTYLDFVASALVHLLSVVDLLNLIDAHQLARVRVARPASGPASALLALFKSFFTVVLLQQIFASVRKGRLLAETITDFWSPHEPIHERARSSLPQYGAEALSPLLLSLRSAETLTREQRDQLPRVLATIGPSAIPNLMSHLDDPNEHVRSVAVSTLGRLRATGALPRIVRLGNDPSVIVRLSLAEALGEIGGPVPKGSPQPPRTLRRRGMWRILPAGRRPQETVADPASFVVPALRAALGDAAAAIRAQAATSFGRLGKSAGAEVIPDLTGLLTDPDETVRAQAAEALGQVGNCNAATVQALAGMLEDPGPAIRRAAAQALGTLGTHAAAAVPALLPLLQDRDEGVRGVAADAIGRMGMLPEFVKDTLSAGLASDDNMTRARTAEALGAIGEAAAESAPALVEALGDDNDRVRAKAVEALGKIGESAAAVAVPRLVRALKDPDNWVSALAAEALGEMGSSADEAVPALVRSLRHPNPHVRANSAEALGKLGPAARAAVEPLERATADEDGGVRLGAVRALGEVGQPTPETIRVVRAALADPAPHTRAAAADAFGLWGDAGEEIRADLLGLLEDTNDEVKARTARVLPKVTEGTPTVVDALCRRLADDDSDWVRVEAARALGQLGPAAATAGGALLRAAQTGDAALREEAMRALAIAQPPESMEAFASGLRDAEPQIRKLASAGWRKAAAVPEEAIPALIEALHDPEIQVRANVAHALGRLEPVPAEAIPLLAECVVHPDAGLRLNAALALQGVPGREVSDVLYPLLNDPNHRLRLVAARRILADDPIDPAAVAVVADALTTQSAGIRKVAAGLVDGIGQAAMSILATMRIRLNGESDSEVIEFVNDAIESLTRIEDKYRRESGLDLTTRPTNPEVAAKIPGN